MKKNTLALIVASVFATQHGPTTHQLSPDLKGRSVLGLSTTPSGDAELLIYGPIGDYFWEGISALSIVEQLSSITASTINVRINSDGGVVSDGLAIFNALKRHGATINVFIDGFAASIASLIAMAGDTVTMPSNTMMMLHAPLGFVSGNAADLREVADVLDVMATSMTESYAAKSKRGDEIKALLKDGRDHWFTAAEAVAFGLADVVLVDEPASETSDAVAAASLLSYITAISVAPVTAIASLRTRLQAATTPTAFASISGAHQRAVFAQLEDSPMKNACHLILAQAGGAAAAAPTAAAAEPVPATAAAAAAPVAAAATPVVAANSAEGVVAGIQARNDSIRGVFANFLDIAGIREVESTCLADPRMTVETAQARLLAKMGGGASPLAHANGAHGNGNRIDNGIVDDEADKQRERIVSGMLARAGILTGDEAHSARQGNPHAHATLIDLAEQSLLRIGVQARGMSRDQIARQVLAIQTTSDFPILLEATINRTLQVGYNLTAFTWTHFAATGSLTDYRPHSRYQLSSFSDLKEVNQAGEYENGVLGDGSNESITGKRKGRILQITPEVLVNDDIGAFISIAKVLGQAAGRTIEKDVYALFALNSGAGPTMKDGKALFHVDHGNIAGTAAAPTVDSWDAARMQLGAQKDPGGNDYLDLSPAIWLGPLSLGTKARVINGSEFNPDVSNKYAVVNTSRGMVRDVVESPRLSGTAWYLFADPNMEPVIEVAFLDGVQTPTIEQETNFRTDGLSWKVVHKYGVGAVGWRGAVKNAGA